MTVRLASGLASRQRGFGMLIRSARPTGRDTCCAFAVMAKASLPGRTKTRLSPPLTFAQAADCNTAFLADIADNLALVARRAQIATFMAFGPPGSAPFFEDRFGAEIGLLETWFPNFGDCLFHAAGSLLDLGYGSSCVLNADSPTLPTEWLIETARVLAVPGDRIVLGPSTDGGYYLLGLKQRHRPLFDDIAWSTEEVAAQTLERANELGLETVMLPPWYDVDDALALHRLAEETLSGVAFSTSAGSYHAPHSAALLDRLRRENALSGPFDPCHTRLADQAS